MMDLYDDNSKEKQSEIKRKDNVLKMQHNDLVEIKKVAEFYKDINERQRKQIVETHRNKDKKVFVGRDG